MLRELAVLALGAVAAIGLGVGLAVVAARRVRRGTLGLEPAEITALHRHHEADDPSLVRDAVSQETLDAPVEQERG